MSVQSFSIHAHFYQPPREDPITGIVPMEPGAAPYLNWNERILAECYRPNARLGNFKHISFNLGPTLFEWIAAHDSQTCHQIIAQDQANLKLYGVGNALAQPYHHTILPLATERDKRTQVAWGIAQFEHRFGRKPEGMWLPETAVDMPTLSALADQGIQFTILAPWQAKAGDLDVTEPYRVQLPEGRSITVFFYHGGLSGNISFNPAMTVNADLFASNELGHHFRPDKIQRGEPQLILLASDGELYGHHQPLRDYFLAQLVDGSASKAGLTPTFPALWVKDNPPRRTIQIRENTSWSCHHGVERWKDACACLYGEQAWKKYLRQAVDRLSIQLDDHFVQRLSPFVPDPWAARDGYIRVVLGLQSTDELIAEMAGRHLQEDDMQCIKLLLEAQFERNKMYASCGWYFEDFDRIEPRNCVAYAASAALLARQATGVDLLASFSADLRQVVSTRTGVRGDQVLSNLLRRFTTPWIF